MATTVLAVGVEHHELHRRAVGGKDQPAAEIGRCRPFATTLDKAPLGAETGDGNDLPADGIDEIECAGAASRNEELAEGGCEAQVVESDAAFAARQGNRESLEDGGRHPARSRRGRLASAIGCGGQSEEDGEDTGEPK